MLFFHTLIRSCDAVETPACPQSLFAEQKFLSLSQGIVLNEIYNFNGVKKSRNLVIL